ncbi:Acetyltransferase (GNAT) family protein [Fodinibius roseus]|uniref:Acetyltransferase (GNAT) family protein n=1 Tax=Fodinibius roseus TaxID=1194090 RepID=A0A1M5F177_9BACT|nr:GNAT family N-acetyltransferase [Fodinibius roseus]SHF85138.1 Acetyltransferase (GNAT) family protein [Fodinibius roseus]
MEAITYSKKESNRFNKKFYRLKTEALEITGLQKQIIDEGVDILVLRLPSSGIDNHHKLSTMGFPYLHADTLVYYKARISELDINEIRNDLAFIRVDENNRDKLENMIPVIFEGYKNHYYSNPFLEPAKISAGYVEWAVSYMNEENKISWLVEKNNKIAGFATCSFDGKGSDCRFVLFGVLPDYAGQGIYSDMIRSAQGYFKERGYENAWASTQVQNYTSQKVWTREGFWVDHSYETYHINAMLSFSANEVQYDGFTMTEDDLNRTGGDRIISRPNDKFAREEDSEIRIVPPSMTETYLSDYLEEKFSAGGSKFITRSNVFLAPLSFKKEYHTRISTQSQNDKEVKTVLATISDPTGNHCLLSYNTLLNQS